MSKLFHGSWQILVILHGKFSLLIILFITCQNLLLEEKVFETYHGIFSVNTMTIYALYTWQLFTTKKYRQNISIWDLLSMTLSRRI